MQNVCVNYNRFTYQRNLKRCGEVQRSISVQQTQLSDSAAHLGSASCATIWQQVRIPQIFAGSDQADEITRFSNQKRRCGTMQMTFKTAPSLAQRKLFVCMFRDKEIEGGSSSLRLRFDEFACCSNTASLRCTNYPNIHIYHLLGHVIVHSIRLYEGRRGPEIDNGNWHTPAVVDADIQASIKFLFFHSLKSTFYV